MGILEYVLLFRLIPYLSHVLSGNQYAYQQRRGCEFLLAELDSFVREGVGD